MFSSFCLFFDEGPRKKDRITPHCAALLFYVERHGPAVAPRTRKVVRGGVCERSMRDLLHGYGRQVCQIDL